MNFRSKLEIAHIKFSILWGLFFLAFLKAGLAQGPNHFPDYNFEETQPYRIELNNGKEFIGYFLHKDTTFITLKTRSFSEIRIPFDQIRDIETLDPSTLSDEEKGLLNPQAHRYFFTPSAFSLKKGELYYQNTYLFLNSLHIGLTPHLSIIGGLELSSTFRSMTGKEQPLVFIGPKLSYQLSKNFHAAGGFTIANIQIETSERGSSAGVVYGMGTYGNKEHHFTAGAGWGFMSNRDEQGAAISLSGMTRVSRRISLLSQNIIFPTPYSSNLHTYGLRIFGRKNALQLGFTNNRDLANIFILGIPYFDFSVKF